MKLTKEFLKKHDACEEGYEWYLKHGCDTVEGTIKKLLSKNKYEWANWLISRSLKTKKDKVRYAVFAAEQVLHIFEKKHPDDKRPCKAIEEAKKYLCGEHINYNSAAADAAAAAAEDYITNSYSAYAAAYAAYGAYGAAAAAYAAYATAAYAAYGAYGAAAAAYASYAVDDKNKTFKKIIRYGMTLL